MSEIKPSFTRFAFSYAFRSLWRNRRRTLLTIATVTLSVAVSIVANRYSTAIMLLWQEGASDTGSAHAQIHAKGYWEEPEGVKESLTLSEGSPIEEKLKSDPFVEAISRRLEFEGIISFGEKSIYFMGIGVDPTAEQLVSPKLFNPKNDKGEFLSSTNKSAVTIGKGLSESLGLKLGDEATLMTQTIQGSVNAVDVVVGGIVNVPLPSFSKRVIYSHIDHAQKLIRMPNKYTELAIRVKNHWDLETWLKDKIEPLVKATNADVHGWWDVEPIIRNVEKIWNSVVGVIAFLLFISAGLSVANIIFMLVAERTVEIGTLMAIGARPKDIRTLFTLEASLIGIIGGACGALVGNLVVLGMDLIGVPFDSPFGSGQVLVHPKMNLGITLIVGAAAIFICYIAALSPSRKAASVEPVKAFRGQMT